MDPKKRLLLAQQANPSLRIAAAPQPQIQISQPTQSQIQIDRPQAPQFQINVQKPSAAPVFQAPQAPKPPQQSLISKTVDSVAAPFKPLGEGMARLLPGGQNDIKANEELAKQLSKNQDTYTNLYKQGKLTSQKYQQLMKDNAGGFQASSKESQRIADTADRSQVVGSALLTAAAPIVGAGDALAATLGGKIAIGAAEGGALGGVNAFATEKEPSLRDIATQAALGTAAGATIPAVGSGLSFLKGKLFGVPASVGLDKAAVKFLKKEQSPQSIQAFLETHLGRTGDDVVAAAQQIAGAKSSKQITNILGEVMQHSPEAAVGGAIVREGVQDIAKDKAAQALKNKADEAAPRPNVEPLPQGTDGGTISLPDQSNVSIKLPQSDLDAIKEAGGKYEVPTDDPLRTGVVANTNAKDVVKSPGKVGEAITKEMSADSPDTLSTVVRTVAGDSNKDTIRQIVEGLRIPGNTNKLIKDLTKESDPAKVSERLNKHIDEWANSLENGETGIDATLGAKTDNSVSKQGEIAAETNSAGVEQAAQDVSTTQNGVSEGAAKYSKGEASDEVISPDEMGDIISTNRKRFGDENVQTISSDEHAGIRGKYKYKDDMISLVNGKADHDTIDHESIHKAMGQFLSDGEIEQLYSDIVKVRGGKSALQKHYNENGYPDATWRTAAEEELANTFVSFMKDGFALPSDNIAVKLGKWAEEKGLPQPIVEILYKLSRQIDEHFGRNAAVGQIEDFYKKVDGGDFATATRRDTKYAEPKSLAGKIHDTIGNAAVKVTQKSVVPQSVYDKALDFRYGKEGSDLSKFQKDSEIAPNGARFTRSNKEEPAVPEEIAPKADAVFNGKASEHLSDESNHFIANHLVEGMSKAESAAKKTVKGYSKQKATRAAEGLKKAEGLTGQARVNAIKSSLKGEYDKVKYKGLGGDLSTAEKESHYTRILDEVQNSPDYKDRAFDTVNFDTAWRKAWFPDEAGSPTKSDIKAIRDALGDGIADKIVDDIEDSKTGWDHVSGVLADLSGAPKGMMASMDFSFGLRQGAKLGARFPKEWAMAQKDAATFVASPKKMNEVVSGIKNFTDDQGDNIFEGFQSMKLKLNALDDMHEEQMAGIQSLRDKTLKLFKMSDSARAKVDHFDPIAASDRAYSGAATMQRAYTAQTLINKYGGIKAMEEKLGKDGLEALGTVINSSTGAADLGTFEKYAPFLGKTLFSPRLWKSNLDVLNPGYYIKLARKSPEAAKLALQTNAAFATTMGTVIAAAGALGAHIEKDPTSSDFMKIKIGNTRYDVLGGLQQNVVLLAREILNEKKNSTTGEKTALSGPDHTYGGADRLSVFLDFLQNKSNPLLGAAAQIARGEDKGGNPVNPLTTIGNLAVPLNLQSVKQTAEDVGSLPKGAAMNVPGFFGTSVQTYGATKTKDQGKVNSEGVPEYAGKVEDNMVKDANGKVLLDKKGKPVTVKFPEGADEATKQALLDDKRQTALGDQYKRSLSTKDQAFIGKSKDELKAYVSDGTISQEYANEIQNKQKTLESQKIGNNYKVPTGATTDLAKNFYKKFNSMDQIDQKYWLKEAPDDNAKTIASELNAKRNEGLGELKPSNELSKTYAEYENKLNTHPEWTDIDKRNETKSFWTNAYKLNYSSNQRDVYSEGGSADLKALIENKQITKEDLNAAIQMDNELYASGLAGLKFTKKFRNTYGFSTPDDSGSGSGGGSGSSKSTNAHLADLLPSVGKAPEAPKFNKTSRGIKFKSNANIPSSGAKAKVSIKL